ncbi:MAG: DegT/DnrJ/EryC1/StrS family aminotransferase [Actinomycetales bacterium]|nr:DegT/DnrJ/EryC1/StrS family aminotransferase [Actinomycetales bacterium]
MIPVTRVDLAGNEARYLQECIDTGWISSEGPFVRRFEADMATLTGQKEGIAVANGSVALDLALSILDLRPGDEVIMPDFTIISCASAVVRAGCVPVFVDAESITWNMDTTRIEAAITARTRAIMVVHIYGLPTDMESIRAIADKHGLLVIEDAAEAHGQSFAGTACGGFGDVATFSFYANKHVSCGEGGMVLTSSAVLAERAKRMRNLGFDPARRFFHETLGWNYRMTNLQAAVGCAQLERLPATVERKREIGLLYREQLADLPLQFAPDQWHGSNNHYWVVGAVIDESVDMDAVTLGSMLRERGVDTRPFFWPMSQQPVLASYTSGRNYDHPVAARLARRGLYFPAGTAISDDDVLASCAAIRDCLT